MAGFGDASEPAPRIEMHKKLRAALLSLPLLFSTPAWVDDLMEREHKAYPSESDKLNGFVTIFRESHFVGGGIDAALRVNGLTYGYVLDGSGIRIGLPPGLTKLDVYAVAGFGHLSIPIEIDTGTESYVELSSQPNPMYAGGIIGYALSRQKSDVHQYCGDGWCAAVEPVDVALPKLQKIKLKAR